ncbi:GNAT family N-acetyltransferase [Candidatus Thiodictyon syntrophicum]|jgi:RimJ/RimL family protein N-acetyltransferase|uniref:N-acetyltransferase domain-containing protein n=1 Tax=Candidatus Thiodictyon syntrophicum TaxID=1166950 RepID=A0A2K8UDG6_9GAMM|nr:GNAT family N-acetyltransferase [Candidatus Thiodictyon syntrophicum]AUB83527.1 hypothetical protein THSYN_22970 [Candidatus Thiodictyon syntrophicum]
MISLQRYGIILRQIGPDDLEKVRLWRNGPDVVKYMAYRDEITPQMQQRWFQGLCKRGDLYFLICDAGKDVGVINLKDIDRQKQEAEGGIFMGAEEFCNSLTPFRASLCLADFGFEVLGLQRIRAHILDGNRRAIRYNTLLGYKPTQIIVDQSNRRYYLERADHYHHVLPRLAKVMGYQP